ncbi:MAG: hypothetical protein ACT4PV_11230 [Planctomycetaceae bacterium]
MSFATRTLPFRSPAVLLGKVALLALVPCAAFPIGGTVGLLFPVLGLTVAFIFGLSAAILVRQSRRSRVELDAIGSGTFHAHWTYTAREWEQFVESESRRGRWLPLLSALLALLCVGLPAGLAWEDRMRLGDSALLHFGAAGMLAAVAGLGVAFGVRALQRRALAGMASAARECFLGHNGLYLAGRYWPFQGIGRSLTGAVLERGSPSRIVFSFEVRTRHGSTTNEVRVPVPQGREAEAETALHNLLDA